MLTKINFLWRSNAAFNLSALDNGFFLVKFQSKEDYEFSKYGGPWLIFDHYLTVQPWRPTFDTNQTTLHNLFVWIRLPCLPLEYFDYKFLIQLGAKFGKPVKIDTTTSVVSRGNFARLCVEVDLSKPLISKFKLRHRVRRVAYEGIHMVCFECGKYGHRNESCPAIVPKNDVPNGQSSSTNVVPPMEHDSAFCNPTRDPLNMETPDPYGPWMLAPKRIRRPLPQQVSRDHETRLSGQGKPSCFQDDRGHGKGKAKLHPNSSNIFRQSTRYDALIINEPEHTVGVSESDDAPSFDIVRPMDI